MTFQLSTILFISVSLLIFYLIAPAYRGVFLCLASLVFIGFLDINALGVLIAVTIMTYLFGFASKRKVVFGAAIVVYIMLFFFWKYLPFRVIDDSAKYIIPLGFSFLLYMSRVPKFTSGPIERADRSLSLWWRTG